MRYSERIREETSLSACVSVSGWSFSEKSPSFYVCTLPRALFHSDVFEVFRLKILQKTPTQKREDYEDKEDKDDKALIELPRRERI